MLPYTCTNEDCNWYGKTQGVARGAEANCRACGWSMTADDDERMAPA